METILKQIFSQENTEWAINLLSLAKRLNEVIDNEVFEAPVQLNLLDQIHANENSHTRILIELLRYKRNRTNPFLSSFLLMALRINKLDSFTISNPEIRFNENYIDCHIYEKDKYSIIIENKINWATDQNKQIDTYVNNDICAGFSRDQIYVIYLTDNGIKKVTTDSYSVDTANVVGDHFIEMNYRDHVLPWLLEDVLSTCQYKDDILISAIKQYADYLEGRFGIRSYQIQAREKNKKNINSILGINDMDGFKKNLSHMICMRNEVSKFETAIDAKIKEFLSPLMNDFIATLSESIKEKGYELTIDNGTLDPSFNWMDNYANHFFSVKPKWKYFEIRFQFEKTNLRDCFYGYYNNSGFACQDFEFHPKLQEKFGQKAQFDNKNWVWKWYSPCQWDSVEAVQSMLDGSLSQQVICDILQMIDIANHFDM